MLESSQLRTEVSPAYLATLIGSSLQGERSGRGKLSATFGDGPSGSKDFSVAAMPGVDQLRRLSREADLRWARSPTSASLRPALRRFASSSSKPGIVEVTADNRLIGRGGATAQIEVAQGSRRRTVEATVVKAEFQSLAIDPGSVVVAVDDTAYPRVVGRG